MWEEAWVPKIGDFGLAAEAMDDPNNENNGVLIPTPITSLPPSPVKSSFSNSMTATDDNTNTMAVVNLFNGNGKPKRPKPRRTRTIGVGTRTVSSFVFDRFSMREISQYLRSCFFLVCLTRTISNTCSTLR